MCFTVEAQAVLDGAEGRVQGQRPGGQRLHGCPHTALLEGTLLLRRTSKIIYRQTDRQMVRHLLTHTGSALAEEEEKEEEGEEYQAD